MNNNCILNNNYLQLHLTDKMKTLHNASKYGKVFQSVITTAPMHQQDDDDEDYSRALTSLWQT